MSSRRTTHALSTSVAAAFAVLAMVLASAGTASAYWPLASSGTAVSTTATLTAPTDVTVPPTSAGDVLVEWSPSSGSVTPTGYSVTRTSGGATADACGTSPTVLVPGPSCTDTALADGEYSYVVTAVFRSWTARSSSSAPVVVVAP